MKKLGHFAGLTGFAAVAMLCASQANATTVYLAPEFAFGNQQDFSGTLGMDFTVNQSGYAIDQLGAFTDGNTTIHVALFDITAGGTLASVDISGVPPPGPHNGYNYLYVNSPVTLLSGHAYQIAAWGYTSGGGGNGDYNQNISNVGAVTTNGALPAGLLTFDSQAYYNLTAGALATSNSGQPFAYGAGNLDIVSAVSADIGATPLPAALPLFATGLGALGLLGWRRKKKAAAIAA
jgi:hypothetical protein